MFIKELLRSWNRRAVIALDAHYDAARHYSRRHYWFGVPAAVLSAIVGSTVFASLEHDVDSRLRFLVATLSMAAAILIALQTFLGYSERAEKHRMTGARYGATSRELEVLLTEPEETLKTKTKLVESTRQRLDTLAAEAPSIPNAIWDHAKKRHRSITSDSVQAQCKPSASPKGVAV